MENVIKEYEERLRLAMINSDIEESDKLLSDDLIFVNHFGQLISKDDDLSAHKQGIFKLTKINVINQNIRMINDVAIVISDVEVGAVINSEKMTDHLIYTRIWQSSNNEWKLISGQATRTV